MHAKLDNVQKHEVEVENLQTQDSHLRHKSWQVKAKCTHLLLTCAQLTIYKLPVIKYHIDIYKYTQLVNLKFSNNKHSNKHNLNEVIVILLSL